MKSLLTLTLFFVSFLAFSQQLKLYDLIGEHKDNLIADEKDSPIVGSKLEATERNRLETVRTIRISTDVHFTGNLIWESGKTNVNESSLAVKVMLDVPQQLSKYLNDLAIKEKNPLLKRHFETVARFTLDTTHGFEITAENIEAASNVLDFFKNEGAKWETYENGPRPLMMSFKSPTDCKYSYYWLIVPRNFNKNKKDYPLYMELHGSGGGRNNNPREMLYRPLKTEVAGVTSQGYRKEGLYIYPWGRGDKGYRDIAEKDIFDVLADFDNTFKTDPKRQYLYGFSMGGAGTFRIAQQSLDRWTAIGVYSGAMRNPTLEEAEKFKDIPVWMTWGELEERLSEVNTKLKDLFLEAGVEVKWQVVEGVGHRYLGGYQEDLMDWFKTHIKE